MFDYYWFQYLRQPSSQGFSLEIWTEKPWERGCNFVSRPWMVECTSFLFCILLTNRLNYFQFLNQGFQGAPGKPGLDGPKGQPVSVLYCLLTHAIENRTNQNIGKPLYTRRYYTQPSHRALRSCSCRNLVSGAISSFFQVLFEPCQSQIFPSA